MAFLHLNQEEIAKASDNFGEWSQPVPPGEYSTVIKTADIKPTKSGADALFIEFSIENSEYFGDIVSDWLNLYSRTEKARNIGYSKLKTLSKMLGYGDIVNDTAQLVGGKVNIVVSLEDTEYTTQDGETKKGQQNRVKKYMAYTLPVGQIAARPQVQQTQQAQQNRATPPPRQQPAPRQTPPLIQQPQQQYVQPSEQQPVSPDHLPF